MRPVAPIALAALLLAAGAQAQTLRWASQGDPQTMDPHSQNESMTNMMNGQVYERLTSRDRNLKIVPGLATEWQQVSPLVWRFKLRPNVRFHDGGAMTADDVVYSVLRGQQPTSQINNYAAAVGTPKKIDDLTVEFTLAAVNPIFLEHLDALWIMSKAWSEKNKVTRPLDFTSFPTLLLLTTHRPRPLLPLVPQVPQLPRRWLLPLPRVLAPPSPPRKLPPLPPLIPPLQSRWACISRMPHRTRRSSTRLKP